MILSIENNKDATKKLLELINKFSKVVGYKINTQKSVALLYANNKRTEKEIKETILPKETKVARIYRRTVQKKIFTTQIIRMV